MTVQATSAGPVLAARGIRKAFGAVVAIDDVDLDLHAGRVHGLVGANGAGKTTLLGILLGLVRPDAGALSVSGRTLPASELLGGRSGVAGFVDGPSAYPRLTARDNLLLAARLSGRPPAEVDAALARVGLTAVAGQRAGRFSLGMRQRLGLALALLDRPRVLVLDEPANGLDPAAAADLRLLLGELADAGVAVLLSSHVLSDVELLCETVTVLSAGRVLHDGPVPDLLRQACAGTVLLRTSDDARARAQAARRGLERLPSEDGLLVRGPIGDPDGLVADVLAAGIAVHEVRPVRPTLASALDALLAPPGPQPEEAASRRPQVVAR